MGHFPRSMPVCWVRLLLVKIRLPWTDNGILDRRDVPAAVSFAFLSRHRNRFSLVFLIALFRLPPPHPSQNLPVILLCGQSSFLFDATVSIVLNNSHRGFLPRFALFISLKFCHFPGRTAFCVFSRSRSPFVYVLPPSPTFFCTLIRRLIPPRFPYSLTLFSYDPNIPHLLIN